MVVPVMLAYVGAGEVDSSPCLPSWSSGTVLFVNSGTGDDGTIRKFNLFPNGNELGAVTATALGIAGVNSGQAATALSTAGDIVFISAVGNSAQLANVSGTSLALNGTFGSVSGSLAPSNGTRILLPYSMGKIGSSIVSGALFDALPGAEICVLTANPLANGSAPVGYIDEALAVIGGGQGTDFVFVLGKNTPGQYVFPQTTPLGLYKLVGAGFVKKGTVSPAQVDSSWVHFTGAQGVACDQTDGNAIILVTTTDAVTNQTYLVKLNGESGAVIWTCPVDAFYQALDENMKDWQITKQRLFYMGSSGRLYSIDTATGASTSQVLSIWVQSGGQVSEDLSGSIFMFGSWNDAGTNPQYIGQYMGVDGHHTLSEAWARFFPGGYPKPPGYQYRKFSALAGPVIVA